MLTRRVANTRTRRRTPLRQALMFGALVLTTCALALAQQGRRVPQSFLEAARPVAGVERVVVPFVDTAALLFEDAAKPIEGGGLTRFAQPLETHLTPEAEGSWETLDDGARLWRLRIASPGALSLNLGLTTFSLPEGAKLWLYSPDGTQYAGPYTHAHETARGLWTPIILGDELVLELYLPAGAGDADLVVGRVNHGYRFFGEAPTKQGRCQNDVVCPEAKPYADQVRSVAWYTLEGYGTCTGTLMNDTASDLEPYFLSAEHCEITPANAATMVVYWNYQSPTCGALSGGRLTDHQTGARFIASYRPSDFVLVELNRRPDPAFHVYYSGWNAINQAPNGAVGIHHPNLDEKAISFSHSPLRPDGQTHWEIVWDDGTTEPGSSGSCIFDANKRCVGTLTGGYSFCQTPHEPDYYGRFAVHWTGGGSANSRLRDWLDPRGTGQLTLDGRDSGGGSGGGGNPSPTPAPSPPTGASCTADAHTLCLGGGRFAVTIDWRDDTGPHGRGNAVAAHTDASGLFWFYNQGNWEMLVRVVDGCAVNHRRWVLAATTSSVGYTLHVQDTETGTEMRYFNRIGRNPPPIADTNAFACN